MPFIRDLSAYPVATSPNTLTLALPVNGSGRYETYLRILRWPGGGSVLYSIDGANATGLMTSAGAPGFEWVKIYDGALEPNSSITFTDEHGLNVLNAVFLRKSGLWDDYLDGRGIIYVYKSNDFVEMSAPLHVYGSRVYYTSGNVSIDGQTVGPAGILLAPGTHNLVKADGSGDIIIYDRLAKGVMDALANGTMPEKAEVSYGPGGTGYRVSVNSTGPALLVWTEMYDFDFLAAGGSGQIRSIPISPLLNAFPLPAAGHYELSVGYGPQGWFDIGLALSALFIIGCVCLMARRWDYG